VTRVRRFVVAEEDALDGIVRRLLPLPPSLRYYDDFADMVRTIRDLPIRNSVIISLDGAGATISLETFGPAAIVVKHVLVDWFSRADPHTVVIRLQHLCDYVRSFGLRSFQHLIAMPPQDVRIHWHSYVRPKITAQQASAAKAMLYSLCNLSIGAWNSGFAGVVRNLTGPTEDPCPSSGFLGQQAA
jgi:hypothetical protein